MSSLWGIFYPVDCPPQSAKPKDIEPVYRLTLNALPTTEDFLSHKEAGKNFPPEKECEACAVSVFTDYSSIVARKKKITAYKRKGYIACGKIESHTGSVSEPDEKSHVNWWVHRGIDASKYFK